MNVIKYARLRSGLTQQELANRAGVSQPALARIERDRVIPRFDTVNKLIAACGLRLEPVPAAGEGLDRTAIAQMLTLTPAERLAVAAQEANNLSKLVARS